MRSIAYSRKEVHFADVVELVDLPTGRQARTILYQEVMHYHVYVLKSLSRKYIYVGLTDNIERRINQHQQGKEKTTAPYRPFELVLVENFETRPDAREREKYLKSGYGKEWIKRKIQEGI